MDDIPLNVKRHVCPCYDSLVCLHWKRVFVIEKQIVLLWTDVDILLGTVIFVPISIFKYMYINLSCCLMITTFI